MNKSRERCRESSRESPVVPASLLPPDNLLHSGLPSLSQRRGQHCEREAGDGWRAERAGVPTHTDVQTPKFNHKLNLMSKLMFREINGLVQGHKAGRWGLDPGKAVPGFGTQTIYYTCDFSNWGHRVRGGALGVWGLGQRGG